MLIYKETTLENYIIGELRRPHLTITVSMSSYNIIVKIKLSYEGLLLYLNDDRVFFFIRLVVRHVTGRRWLITRNFIN